MDAIFFFFFALKSTPYGSLVLLTANTTVHAVLEQVLLIRKTVTTGAKKTPTPTVYQNYEANWVCSFCLTFFYSPPHACFCYYFPLRLKDSSQLHNLQPAEVDCQQLHSVTSHRLSPLAQHVLSLYCPFTDSVTRFQCVHLQYTQDCLLNDKQTCLIRLKKKTVTGRLQLLWGCEQTPKFKANI